MNDKIVNYKALGKRIQQRRQELGLSQQATSEKLDLSTSFFSRVERGEKVASLETLIKIANVFEFSLDFLLQDSLDKTVSDDLQIEVAQIFTDKTPEQTKRLMDWLKMLSENIDRLG
ncbi:MAG: helix-turn-helix domain-containing protein [Oscillospiraceae bacterium]|nr:helix-turn-helix domain-containing protein [Oscillospiraceae bacterium]